MLTECILTANESKKGESFMKQEDFLKAYPTVGLRGWKWDPMFKAKMLSGFRLVFPDSRASDKTICQSFCKVHPKEKTVAKNRVPAQVIEMNPVKSCPIDNLLVDLIDAISECKSKLKTKEAIFATLNAKLNGEMPNFDDAPTEYDNAEAFAWAQGYGSAIEKIKQIVKGA